MKKKRKLLALLVLFHIQFFGCWLVFPQTELKSGSEFKFEVLKEVDRSRISFRGANAYIFLPTQFFNKANLIVLFRQLSARYPSDRNLSFVVASDLELLKRQVLYDESGSVALNANTLRNPANSTIGRPEGLLRAFYYRNAHDEKFQYSPRSESIMTIWVTLRDKKEYHEDIDSFVSLVSSGYLEGVKAFLQRNPGFKLNCPDSKGNTPLAAAVWLFHNEIAEELLKHGADANIDSVSGGQFLRRLMPETKKGFRC